MRKNIFTLAVLSLIVLVSACQKEEITPDNPNNDTTPTTVERRAAYLGTYDMTYVTDSVATDGVWLPNGYGGVDYSDDYGYWVISADADDTASVKIDGYVVYVDDESGDSTKINYYNTRATFDDQGRLMPETNVLEYYGYTFTNYYRPIQLTQDGIQVQVEQHLPYGDMDFGYLITANGVRRAE